MSLSAVIDVSWFSEIHVKKAKCITRNIFSFYSFSLLASHSDHGDLSEGSDIDAENSNYFEDKNNNEWEDSISDPDHDVTADLLAKAQWRRDMFEEEEEEKEEDFGEFVWFPRWMENGGLSPMP